MKNKDLVLTEDQQACLDEIVEWLKDKNLDSNFKSLVGYAGTGKTTLLDYVVDKAENELRLKTIVTATTNKAVKVLRDKVESSRFSTIHSVLGIKAKQVGTLEIFEPDNYNDSQITDYDFVIIDEASMISSEDKNPQVPSLLTIIKSQCEFSKTKVLFCGDSAQLQPINENISKCFDFDPVRLTTIVRHNDGISKVAEKLRNETSIVHMSKLLNPPDIVSSTNSEASQLFKDWRLNPDSYRLLTWRNVSVDRWNRMLRAADYGDHSMDFFIKGDIIIANEPCFKIHPDEEEEQLMANSQEAEVLSVKQNEKRFKLKARMVDSGKIVTLNIIKKSYEQIFRRSLNALAAEKSWKEYWRKRKYFHDIKHCYSMTVHKSQGSTFENIVVDTKDIQFNKDVQNRNQLLYVAITRAANKVYLI